MAARKLQTEIDRVIKKVAEGVETFEDTLEKLNEATNPTMKEKYEQELKKEIKKLQRFRDQIKTWLGSNEIKDKRQLLENRKLIEHQMERFKAIEKELKTKPFSKEGINQAIKVDPMEREKEELGNWISSTIDNLTLQIERTEAEVEMIQGTMRKSKKSDGNKAERIAKLEEDNERHKHHIDKLEIVLRLLENGNLLVEQVKNIQDSIDYYVESNQDPDFQEDETIYDDLDLDDAEAFGLVADDEKDDSSLSLDGTPGTPPKEKEPVASPVKPIKQPGLPAGFQRVEKKEEPKLSPKMPTTPTKTPRAAPSPRAPPTPVAIQEPLPLPLPQQKWVVAASSGPSAAQIVAGEDRKKAAVPAKAKAPPNVVSSSPIAITSNGLSPTTTPQSLPSPPAPQLSLPTPIQVAVPKSILQEAVPGRSPPMIEQDLSQPQSPQQQQLSIPHSPLQSSPQQLQQQLPLQPPVPQTLSPQQQDSMENRLPPSLTDLVASFEATKERSLKARDDTSFLQHMLETGFRTVPDALDSERPKYQQPKNPYPTPSYYPQAPLPVFENAAIFEKFDIDTLFFIFYYQQETYQQYLAARELKRQSWRFHKKYLTWFQRHEEPKIITDEYEQGTYIYFDYEGAWCQRKKTEFRFEYRYLEDAELV